MPVLRVIKDIDQHGGIGFDLDQVTQVTEPVIIGSLSKGMTSGKTSIVIALPLPDGTVAVAETSLALFKSAGEIMGEIPE